MSLNKENEAENLLKMAHLCVHERGFKENENIFDRAKKNNQLMLLVKKDDLGITKNCKDITLIAISQEIYNTLLLNCIRPKVEKVLRKDLEAKLLFVDFYKIFDSMHREKMKQILLAYGFPKETVSILMILYKDTRAMVYSFDGDIDFFDVVAGILQGDTLAPFLFILYLDYVLRTTIDLMKEKWFNTKKKQEANDTLQKWLLIQTSQIIERFL